MPSVVTYDNQRRDAPVAERAADRLDRRTSASGGADEGFDGLPVDAGVTLVVSPHISADNYLRLDIELEVSARSQGDSAGRRPAAPAHDEHRS